MAIACFAYNPLRWKKCVAIALLLVVDSSKESTPQLSPLQCVTAWDLSTHNRKSRFLSFLLLFLLSLVRTQHKFLAVGELAIFVTRIISPFFEAGLFLLSDFFFFFFFFIPLLVHLIRRVLPLWSVFTSLLTQRWTVLSIYRFIYFISRSIFVWIGMYVFVFFPFFIAENFFFLVNTTSTTTATTTLIFVVILLPSMRFRYDIKLHSMVRLLFLSSRECWVTLHCHYSQVHSDSEWLYMLGSHLWVK